MANLLGTVQEVCKRLAQNVPATVFGSTDKQVIQFLSLLQSGLDVLVKRAQWQILQKECTFVTIANEDQGLITALGGGLAGYDYLLPYTLWDRTNKLTLVGPLDPQDWQAMKAWIINGPRYQFRLRGNHFLVNPAPSAGWTWAFEYMSTYAITDVTGVTFKDRFTADTDIILLPEPMVELDLTWRWKQAKGLGYAEEFNSLEAMLADIKTRENPGKTLRFDDYPSDAQPGIYVPAGNWRVP